MNAKDHVSQLPIIKLRGLMKNLREVEEAKPEYDPSKAILVEHSVGVIFRTTNEERRELKVVLNHSQ